MSTNRLLASREKVFRRLFILALLGITAMVSLNAQAQGPPMSERDSVSPIPLTNHSAGSESVRLQQSPLDAIILFNPAGKRSIVLPGGWPLEVLDEFSRFLLKDQEEPTTPFTIQGILARGRVNGSRVEATVHFVLSTSGSRTVRIPLGMKEGILPFSGKNEATDAKDFDSTGTANDVERKGLPVRYAGPGTLELAVDSDNGQYLAIIHPKRRDARKDKATSDPSSETETTDESNAESGEGTDENSMPSADESDLSDQADLSAPSLLTNLDNESGEEHHDSESNSSLQRHELTLTLWFPLIRIGDEEQRLSVSFPQSVSSQFVLTVPLPDAVATAAQGTLLDVVSTTEQKSTRFNVLGLKSNFEISWRKRKTEQPEERPVLRVEDAMIIARMETRSIVYDATLPVRSPTGTFDRLRIRLPQDAVLDREECEKHAAVGGYSYRLLPKEEWDAWVLPSNESDDVPPILEIQFPYQTTGPVKIQLKTIQHLPEKPNSWRYLGGFEVLGAERQRGTLSVGIPSEMRSHWKTIRGVRRIDLPPALSQEGLNACFEFFNQPFLLGSQIVSPQTRINVRPEYQVAINKGTMTLSNRFTYFIHGSKTEKLSVQLFDWQWSGGDIRPSNIVDVEGVSQDESGLLNIPLRVPSEGEFEIFLKVHRALSQQELEKKQVVVRIPQPDADWVEPAAPFVVVPADNVEITPVESDSDNVNQSVTSISNATVDAVPNPSSKDPVRMSGLTRRARRSVSLQIELPNRQQEPLVYQTESANAFFVGDIQFHRQEIKASIQNDVRLLDPTDQISEIITYDVAYEPIDRILLAFPPALQNRDDLRFSIGGKQLEPQNIVGDEQSESSTSAQLKRITLPETTIGKFQLIIRYGIPTVHATEDMATTVNMPFVRPMETTVSSHLVNMIVPPGVQVELHDSADRLWKEEFRRGDEPGSLYTSGGNVFSSQDARDQISLRVELADRDVLGTTVVERSWLQTWLSDSTRMDRGTYQITSNRDSISIWLPSAVARNKIVVKRDRIRIPVRLSPNGELSVPLTGDQKGKPVLLEIWYEVNSSFKNTNRMELPYFSEEALVRCAYWQILLPWNRHIIGVPNGWTPEYQWSWRGFFWGRIPSIRMNEIGLNSDSLEDATVSDEINQYLYSSLHPVSEISFQTAERSLIVLLSSSLSLLIGLVLIYFPKTRYAGCLFGLSVALIGIVLYQPAPVLLMLQASFFGVVLALFSNYIYRIIYREEKWIIPKAPNWGDSSRPSEVYSVIMDESDEQAEPTSNPSTS